LIHILEIEDLNTDMNWLRTENYLLKKGWKSILDIRMINLDARSAEEELIGIITNAVVVALLTDNRIKNWHNQGLHETFHPRFPRPKRP
jgi:hypothetical protein